MARYPAPRPEGPLCGRAASGLCFAYYVMHTMRCQLIILLISTFFLERPGGQRCATDFRGELPAFVMLSEAKHLRAANGTGVCSRARPRSFARVRACPERSRRDDRRDDTDPTKRSRTRIATRESCRMTREGRSWYDG